MTITITTAPEVWPLPATRCIFRGRLMDYETAAFILAMEAELGYVLTVEQGCYNPGGVAASAGTHDGGQVFDLAPFDWQRKVRVARSLGGFAWHRLPSQGPWNEHIHIGIRGGPTLSGAARNQQVDFDKRPRRNGLANHLIDPDQDPTRPPPTPSFRYPPPKPATPTFRGVSLNDDWGNLASDVASVVRDVRPLVMGVQEGWRVDYHKAIHAADPAHPARWKVRQVMETKATAGVAVIWDHRRLQRIGTHRGDPSKKGWGLQVIGRAPDTRDRPVLWQDVMFRPGVDRGALPKRFRLASVHRYPVRDKKDWDEFDAVLGLWLKRSPLPVLLFTDSNQHGGPEPLMSKVASAIRWHADGDSIDGCVTSLPVRGVKALPKRTSDHAPVVVTLG